MSIQSIILNIHASGSSSGSLENSGLKYDQFIAMCAGGTGCGGTGGVTGFRGCWVGVVVSQLVQEAVVVLLLDPLLSFPSLSTNSTSFMSLSSFIM